MAFPIRRVAVIGAGTMGGAIAAHAANAGLTVDLLDIVPTERSPDEERRHLPLSHALVRSRFALGALDRLRKATPPAFFTPDVAARVRPGNLEDHLDRLRNADWIIEAVIERLDVKRELVARIDACRKPTAIVSTNTSGIPVRAIAKHASDGLKAHFLGTHFFNPPRYMKLVELIPLADTQADVVSAIRHLLTTTLGKGVAVCKDTPNFVANRYAAMSGAMTLTFALEHGYTVEEVDAITGPLTGRPKTATFRLLDLVGVDIAALVNQNLYELAANDESREVLVRPQLTGLFARMLERKLLGEKSGRGFYARLPRDRGGAILTLDLDTLEYRERREPAIASLAQAARIPHLIDRWRFLLAQDDKAGALVRHMRRTFAYMSCRVPEICDDYPTVDRVIRWGFNHELGPFETWDGLGLEPTLEAFDAEGVTVAPWVRGMKARGTRFYEPRGGTPHYFDLTLDTVVPEPPTPRIVLDRVRTGKGVVKAAAGASLLDIGDDVLCLEVHSKLNTLDEDVVTMMQEAVEQLAGRWVGLVMGNDGPDFGVGANLVRLLQAIDANRPGEVASIVKRVQDAMQGLRTAPKPVVAAPFGRALGGSCEMVLAASRVVAAAETYAGLVEIGVGLLPAAGGCKEMVRRRVSPGMRVPGGDPMPLLRPVLQTLGLAKVSSSAADARELGFLAESDRVVMNRDDLLAEAKAEVLRLAEAGYQPPRTTANCYAAGRQALATLETGLYLMEQGGYATHHDRVAAAKIASVLCGGDLTAPQWVDEQYLLDLECDAFVSLCGEPKTVERMKHLLATGKPLRN